jgi:very-short-patch-repair endonuclease
MTTGQAIQAGLTVDQLRTLSAHGWRRPTRGVYISPSAAGSFRASVRAALLVRPDGTPSHLTAARLRDLRGLPRWTPAEHPHLLLPQGRGFNSCNGLTLHSGLRPEEKTSRHGFPVTSLDRTVIDMASVLALDDLVCLVDSAMQAGWRLDLATRRLPKRLRSAAVLADARSESTFETLVRLVLVRARLAPEALQFKVFDDDGRHVARLDFAWPGVKVGLEADGREYHDLPQALHRDRVRANRLANLGWRIFRVTWDDLIRRPAQIVAMIRDALSQEVGVIRAS